MAFTMCSLCCCQHQHRRQSSERLCWTCVSIFLFLSLFSTRHISSLTIDCSIGGALLFFSISISSSRLHYCYRDQDRVWQGERERLIIVSVCWLLVAGYCLPSWFRMEMVSSQSSLLRIVCAKPVSTAHPSQTTATQTMMMLRMLKKMLSREKRGKRLCLNWELKDGKIEMSAELWVEEEEEEEQNKRFKCFCLDLFCWTVCVLE